jgi:prolyl-tRNA synthetase
MIGVEIDNRDIGGARGWDWIKKGIPLRVEIGPRDIADNSLFVSRRDRDQKDKQSIQRNKFASEITNILDEIQKVLFDRALSFKKEHTIIIDDKNEFKEYFTPENQEKPEIHGGFASSFWCGSDACESKIKEDLKVTIRCIPFGSHTGGGKCICCGNSSDRRVFFAKAY